MKKIFIPGILALCLVLGYVSLVMAEETNKVYNSKNVEVGYYEEFTSAQVSELRNVDNEEGNHIAPTTTKSGYVFAGWYGKSDCRSSSALTNEAIDTMLASEENENTTFYAKFVSADILNVKAQLQGGTDSTSENAILRFVTTVDDLDYLEVGFTLVFNGKTYTSNTETVYKRLYAVGTTEKKSTLLPTEFHAGSRYFMAVNLKGIPADVFSKEATAIPYWVTCDGTKVENTDVETKSVVQGMPTVCEALVINASGDESKYYSTLEKAFYPNNNSTTNDYLDDGYTVTVIQDSVEIEACLYINDKVTLTNEAKRDVTIKRTGNIRFIYYMTGLTVEGNVSQDEGGSLTFDGEEKTLEDEKILNTQECIGSSSKCEQLILENVSIINAYVAKTGGAVRVMNGTAEITNCIFTNNEICKGTSTAKGGAIYYSGSTSDKLTVNDCIFTSNKSTSEGGGAIYINNGVAEINDSQFDSNTTTLANGGAIYINQGTTTISGSGFNLNNSASKGGAIYFGEDSSVNKELTVSNCTFTSNNTATAGSGGAIYVNYGTAGVSGSTFTSNGSEGADLGGAIYINQGDTTISGSGFSSNKATSKGGAVYDNLGTVTIQETCTFSENSAASGGALYVCQGKTDISNSTFTSNASTEANGGAIYFGEDTENSKTLTLTSCTFDSNYTVSAGHGGAVYVNSGTAEIGGSTFASNGTIGADMGGAIYLNEGKTTISGSEFSSNEATTRGGAVYDNGGTVTIKENCTFSENSAAEGGALYEYNGATEISDSSFASNVSNSETANAGGGAIYHRGASSSTKLKLTRCTFTSNEATGNASARAGAVYIYRGGAEITGSTFTSNGWNATTEEVTTVNGGAIYVREGDTDILDTDFEGNKATTSGGAVYIHLAKAIVDIKDGCTFSENSATTSGGAIYISAGTTTVSNTDFNTNKVATDGGAIYNLKGALIVNNGCTFTSNAANNSNGGAIYVSDSTATLDVSASTFTSNRAYITMDVATAGGGAIYVDAAQGEISNSVFDQNIGRRGGAIHVNTGTLTMQNDCTFSGNTSRRGGAIFVSSDGAASVTDCIFIGNGTTGTEITTYRGGAIHCAKEMTIDGCVFERNVATAASAAFSSSATFAITNATLINQAETDFNESTSTTKLTLVTQANESATTNSVDNIHDADDGHQLSLLTNIDEDAFEAYCDRIESMGFELRSENEMSSSEENENIARTYYSTEIGYMLHTYWVEYSQEVRTLVAEMDESKLSPLRKLSGTEEESETVSDTSCTPLFHQLEALNYDDTAGIQSLEGGMGYIIRLKDGRFIIIDGGHRTETDPEDTSQTTNVNSDTLEILAFLAKNTPDPKNIVIASWIFTHTHSDHSGAFVNFTKYLDLHIKKVNYDFGTTIKNVTLESVMLNACDTEEQIQYCEKTKGGTEEILTDIIPNYWEAQWGSNPVVYKPLTGQVYTFADTSIEILHTMSDFLPNTIQYEEDGNGGDYNIQSVVSIVDVDNTADKSDRFFIMGDTTAVACNEMSKRYGTYMESDYVQVAHHGYNEFNTGHLNCRRHGATKEIYGYILKDDKSTIVMWPTSDKRFSDKTQTTIPINYWLVTEAPVKEHWIAESVSDENRTIEFE